MKYDVKVMQNPKDICVSVPGSKSITNRALLLAALANGKSCLDGVLFSDDSRHFLQALIDLGFAVEVDEENTVVTIEGLGGEVPKKEASIHVGSAGTAARFLTAYLGLSEGRYYITSSEQMKKRPMKELLVVLEQLGAVVEYEEEEYHFPFWIGKRNAAKKEVTVDVDKSSQFLSALLISSVLLEENTKICISGSHGMAYVNMTCEMMKQFGVIVEEVDGAYLSHKADYLAMDYQIEPDLSAACYFYAMGALLGVSAKVKGVLPDSLQGDLQFLSVLDEMGCRQEVQEDGILMYPPLECLLGGEFDLSSFSDQTLTLAAIAPFAADMVTITNVGHIRFQECDRINAIVSNLRKMNVACNYEDGNLFILPSKPTGAEIETFEDHRVAMSFAIMGLVVDGVVIENPMCCRKTFENYFEVLETLY